MIPGNRFVVSIVVNVPNVAAVVDCLEIMNRTIDVATAAIADASPPLGVVVDGQGGAFVFQVTTS